MKAKRLQAEGKARKLYWCGKGIEKDATVDFPHGRWKRGCRSGEAVVKQKQACPKMTHRMTR